MSRTNTWLGKSLPLWLVCLSFLLLTTKSAFNYPIALLGILGLARLIRYREFDDPDLRLLGALFACIWLPMLISLPDAGNAARTTKTVVSYLHYPLAAVAIVLAMRDAGTRKTLAWVLGLFACVLAADGMLQFLRGTNVLGNAHEGIVLTGLFHPKQRLGIILALLLPLVFEWLRLTRLPQPAATVVTALVITVIVVANKRSAWLTLTLVLLAWPLLTMLAGNLRLNAQAQRGMALMVLVVAASAGTLALTSDTFRDRFAVTSGILSSEDADSASGYRVSLWQTAWNMFTENPVTGVGARGYRYVYGEYAAPDDFWIETFGRGQTHPHGMGLEILAETGLVGATGFIGFWLLLGRRVVLCIRRSPGSLEAGWPVAVLAAWIPVNTHLAFYGTYWSSVAWLLIPVAIASTSTVGAQPSRKKEGEP